MEYLKIFIFCFITVFLLYYLIIVARKKGLAAFKKGKQLMYFVQVYKIDTTKLNIKSFATVLSFTNAIIIAITVTIIELFDNLLCQLIIGFVILVPLIYFSYFIIGKIYKTKEEHHD